MPDIDVDVSTIFTLALEAAFPNPSRGDLRVAFTLPRTSSARLDLIDIAGRRVAHRSVGELGPGRHVIQLTEARSLPAGRYYLRLVQGGHALTTTITTLR